MLLRSVKYAVRHTVAFSYNRRLVPWSGNSGCIRASVVSDTIEEKMGRFLMDPRERQLDLPISANKDGDDWKWKAREGYGDDEDS